MFPKMCMHCKLVNVNLIFSLSSELLNFSLYCFKHRLDKDLPMKSESVILFAGVKQSGVALHDVMLPPWAKGDPREFIRVHREVSCIKE